MLPSPETKLELLKLTIERLTSEGYVYIGMDHFARAGDELAVAQRQKTLQRNFQGYSTRGGADIYAFGMSSISQAEGFYWQNHKDLPDYYGALDAGKLPLRRGYIMTDEDKLRRTTIMRLMCDLGLDYAAMSKLLGLDFKEHFAHELESLDDMEADGLLVKTPQGLIVTDLGRLLIRNIAMRFDAYAGDAKGESVFADDMRSVAIIGAGITGLTAAFYLKRKGVPVTVYEASDRVGGAIQSIRAEGYLAEFGPNTILETSPKVTQLVRDAGLGVAAARSRSARPRRAMSCATSGPSRCRARRWASSRRSSSPREAKLAVLREPFVPPRRDGKEESIAEFVVRRLGQEFLDHAIDALVAGVYAGDPYKLSVPQAFPKLGQLEARYGSLIKGQIFGARERKRRGEVAKDRAPKFSFDEGLQVLPDTLREHLGEAVRLNTAVTRLTQTPEGWTLDLRERGQQTRAEHSAVIYAGTAFRLAEMEVQAAVPLHLATFAEIRYPPVASVVLGFRREDVAHPCEGFGMLIPKVEGFKILGTIFSSSLFPEPRAGGASDADQLRRRRALSRSWPRCRRRNSSR